MSGFVKTIIDLFTYKEPQNEELGFELLEDKTEGIERENTQYPPYDSQYPHDDKPYSHDDTYRPEVSNQKDKVKSSRVPLNPDEWNRTRKSENTACRPLSEPDTLSNELCINLETIKQKFDIPKNQDIIIREFNIGRKIKAFLCFIDGMADKTMLNLSIFPQLMSRELSEEIGKEYPVDYLIANVLTVQSLKKANKFEQIITQVLNGLSALFIDGCSECILIETRGYEKRNVEQPVTEMVVEGPQEGFTENLRTNLTLVRKIIKNEKLVTEILPVGKLNNSNCAVLYFEGLANPKVVQEVKKRIKKIDTDFVMGNGMIEQFIEDNPLMLFPQILTTERPDRTASFLMEGQVVIIAEGTPFAITVPVTFFRLLHTSEDAFVRWPFGTFLRFVRIVGLFCATALPGLYVAVVLFHPEAIPTDLLVSIATAKELVPFPTVLEVLMLEFAFELIREGGIRVPTVIGQTLGIVGALILGQAAVAAGIVSPVVVIIVSVTALGSFVIPNYPLSLAIRIERFFFIAAGAALGILGIGIMTFVFAVFACSMKSFGVPFFSPVAPRTKKNPDVIVRYPIWMQKNRPDEFNTPNRKRQGNNVKRWNNEKTKGRKE